MKGENSIDGRHHEKYMKGGYSIIRIYLRICIRPICQWKMDTISVNADMTVFEERLYYHSNISQDLYKDNITILL